MISLEQIDMLRERANVSYQDAKQALEKCDSDMVEALIYLEKNNKVKEVSNNSSQGFIAKLKTLISKGNRTKFIIKNREITVINIPITIAILLTIFVTPLVIIGLIVALFTNHRIKIETSNGEDSSVNKIFDKMSSTVNDITTPKSNHNIDKE